MKTEKKQSVAIVGAGRLGGALAIALGRKGYKIKALVGRRPEIVWQIAQHISPTPQILTTAYLADLSASDIVVIATPDPQIEPTAARLAVNPGFNPQTVFLHTSGSLSSVVLKQLKNNGASTASLHPLVSVSDAQTGAERFAKAFFCVEGDASGVETAKQIAADLGGESFEINPEFKILYHAAAVMAAGHLVALFDVAAETLSACGVEETDASRVLLPLAKSVVENLGRQTTAQALTGTFARADAETMRWHLESLRTNETALRVYTELGKRSIELAREQGADASRLEEMSNILRNSKS